MSLEGFLDFHPNHFEITDMKNNLVQTYSLWKLKKIGAEEGNFIVIDYYNFMHILIRIELKTVFSIILDTFKGLKKTANKEFLTSKFVVCAPENGRKTTKDFNDIYMNTYIQVFKPAIWEKEYPPYLEKLQFLRYEPLKKNIEKTKRTIIRRKSVDLFQGIDINNYIKEEIEEDKPMNQEKERIQSDKNEPNEKKKGIEKNIQVEVSGSKKVETDKIESKVMDEKGIQKIDSQKVNLKKNSIQSNTSSKQNLGQEKQMDLKTKLEKTINDTKSNDLSLISQIDDPKLKQNKEPNGSVRVQKNTDLSNKLNEITENKLVSNTKNNSLVFLKKPENLTKGKKLETISDSMTQNQTMNDYEAKYSQFQEDNKANDFKPNYDENTNKPDNFFAPNFEQNQQEKKEENNYQVLMRIVSHFTQIIKRIEIKPNSLLK